MQSLPIVGDSVADGSEVGGCESDSRFAAVAQGDQREPRQKSATPDARPHSSRPAARRDALAGAVGTGERVGVRGPSGARLRIELGGGVGGGDLRAYVPGQVMSEREIEQPLDGRTQRPSTLQGGDRAGAIHQPQP